MRSLFPFKVPRFPLDALSKIPDFEREILAPLV
jgi:hypothetical protein